MTQACMVIKGYPGYPSENYYANKCQSEIVHGHSFNVYP